MKERGMAPYKFDYFLKDHGFSFRGVTHLTEEQNEQIVSSIKQNYQVKDIKHLYEYISKNGLYSKVNVDSDHVYNDENGQITAILKELKISLDKRENLYILWDCDDMDFINAADFYQYFFDDIWYPAVDDVFVLNQSLDWILLVTHFGAVIKLSPIHSAI